MSYLITGTARGRDVHLDIVPPELDGLQCDIEFVMVACRLQGFHQTGTLLVDIYANGALTQTLAMADANGMMTWSCTLPRLRTLRFKIQSDEEALVETARQALGQELPEIDLMYELTIHTAVDTPDPEFKPAFKEVCRAP